jgi:D-hexose-6-phosphate mutarotase
MTNLPDGACVERGGGGLERVVLATAHAEAHVYLHGAQLTHFQPAGQEPVLWLSEHSQFAPDKPIRGGVPICFPWFGPKADEPGAPMHGFARLLDWSLASVEKDAAGDLVAALELRSDERTRPFFPQAFTVRMVVTAGRALRMAFTVRNQGDRPFTFEEALHTYFAVGDVRQIRMAGLEGAGYVDKADGGAKKTMGGASFTISGETDRMFDGHRGPITILDPGSRRRLVVERSGSATAVVWNPWVAKAKAMPDFGDDEWTGMVCVESANAAGDALTLEPGASHELATTIEVRPA